MCDHLLIISRINKPLQDIILAILKSKNMILTSYRIELKPTNFFASLGQTLYFKSTSEL